MATSPVFALALLLGAAMATVVYASDGWPVPECIPAEHKQVDCNCCICGLNGKWVCTNRTCPDKVEVETECKPNTTFKKNCNNCTCNSAGNKATCTNYNCSLPYPWPTGCPVCKPGEKKQIDCCNNCTCTSAGGWMCTLMACPDVKEVEIKCKPNTVFKKDCNNCTCNSAGTRACCTTCNCSQPLPGKPGCPACKPGEKKQVDCCNACTCIGPGVWACTLMACPHTKEVEIKCKPNKTFKNDCNNCTCNAEGTKACCTTRNCSLPWPGYPVCIPGEKKWQDCNECHCVGGKR
ncbi:uncharacterized protein LOC126284476 isoform X4 [Schistocerca gregaria]|uniref:uncharacterized protein LOC126284476 isoform X3 n=1 Tax=Schistocerca gregaria TaxID=7010 RepID=UPI00211DB4E6|nr:uncharacterized protein LOC126284476 isoform X3 [Schistocerca gregaria]XP_049839390.1 uncharacterized protein LOC126284476 isoform X4 [Schistocerca gregaria]